MVPQLPTSSANVEPKEECGVISQFKRHLVTRAVGPSSLRQVRYTTFRHSNKVSSPSPSAVGTAAARVHGASRHDDTVPNMDGLGRGVSPDWLGRGKPRPVTRKASDKGHTTPASEWALPSVRCHSCQRPGLSGGLMIKARDAYAFQFSVDTGALFCETGLLLSTFAINLRVFFS